MHPTLATIVVIGTLVAGCTSPVCRAGSVQQAGRCITPSVVENLCEPACSASAHRVCDGDGESPSCICAPGYEGNPCIWAGVIEDPGFFLDEDDWNSTRGANVLPFLTGHDEDGVAEIDPSAACRAGAVSQTVEMPTYETAEPLVAQVIYSAQDSYGASLGFNRAWTQLPATTAEEDWRTERVCLGEAAYGGSILVQLGPREVHSSCFDLEQTSLKILVDRLEILPADRGECPAPGEVLNGTGDAGGGGWQFVRQFGAEADFEEGAGREGTSGVRLAREGSQQLAKAWTRLSVPSSKSLASPALRFWWKGTSDRTFKFEIGRFENKSRGALPVDDVVGNNSELNFLYCLPPWTHGNVLDLIFEPTADSIEPSELLVDDVEIVSDERCGTSPDILDPGFEAGPGQILGVTNFTPHIGKVTRTAQPSLARTGDGALELSYSDEDAVLRFETWVLVPESDGDDGPALFYWSNVPSVATKPIQSVLGRAAIDPADLPVDGGWQQSRAICLRPEWSGRWVRIQFRLDDFPPIGNLQVFPPIRIHLDDFELTTSPACDAD